jgi:two-component sensor histidine kinase
MRLESITSADSAPDAGAKALLEALPEAALLLSRDGTILCSNRAARAFLGRDVTGQPLASLHAGDDDALDRYIGRCFGNSSPLIGSIVLARGADADNAPCRLLGCRASLPGGAAVLLRLDPNEDGRFTALTRKISELHQEIRQRRHAQAVLAETVAERELLLRELQHRVKNNMHMLDGILRGAEREARSQEARDALREVSSRIAAIGAVQQLLYSSEDLETIESTRLIDAVSKGALALAHKEATTRLHVDSFCIPIETAVTVALIVNELLTNAIKYGQPAGATQQVLVEMNLTAGQVTLTISDNGPGFAPEQSHRRASGIGLVKGLLRQLGGSLQIDGTAGGTTCRVGFPLPEKKARRDLS